MSARNEPRAADARRIPEFQAGIQVLIMPKPETVVINRRFLKLDPDGTPVAILHLDGNEEILDEDPLGDRAAWMKFQYEGEPIKEELFDLVTVLTNQFVQRPTSVLITEGAQIPVASLGMVELSRVDLKTFREKARKVIDGERVEEYIAPRPYQIAVDEFVKHGR